jgi:hypothetical protein
MERAGGDVQPKTGSASRPGRALNVVWPCPCNKKNRTGKGQTTGHFYIIALDIIGRESVLPGQLGRIR